MGRHASTPPTPSTSGSPGIPASWDWDPRAGGRRTHRPASASGSLSPSAAAPTLPPQTPFTALPPECQLCRSAAHPCHPAPSPAATVADSMSSPGPRQRTLPVLSAFGAARTPSQLQQITQIVQQAGFASLWVPEGAQPVFEMCTAAALATPSLTLGTSVAVAFARSPMLTAQAAWMLAQATGGRFILGLGTQVRAHVERRYSAAFSSPGPRMREYVQAVRAIYAGFRGAPLRFDGRFYSFSLLTPAWSPGPMEHPDPLIYVAGVRPWMCRMVGEVADGMLVHPLSTRAYLDQIVMPAIEEGRQIAK